MDDSGTQLKCNGGGWKIKDRGERKNDFLKLIRKVYFGRISTLKIAKASPKKAEKWGKTRKVRLVPVYNRIS